jgi:hypothetical protein
LRIERIDARHSPHPGENQDWSNVMADNQYGPTRTRRAARRDYGAICNVGAGIAA